MTSDLQDIPEGFNPMKLLPVDSAGRSVTCEFRYLGRADEVDAACVASWLRRLADSVEDAEFRAKCDDKFTAGYCHPMGEA